MGSQSMTRLLAELSKRRSFSLEVDQRVEEQYNIAPWHQVDGDDEDGGGGDDGRDGVVVLMDPRLKDH